MKPHIFHPDADEEYVQAVQYYADINRELGCRFHDEMESHIREACAHPKRFWQFNPPVRRHLSRDFPYAVVFLEQPERIWIIAVMHLQRRPGYWRGRLG